MQVVKLMYFFSVKKQIHNDCLLFQALQTLLLTYWYAVLSGSHYSVGPGGSTERGENTLKRRGGSELSDSSGLGFLGVGRISTIWRIRIIRDVNDQMGMRYQYYSRLSLSARPTNGI